MRLISQSEWLVWIWVFAFISDDIYTLRKCQFHNRPIEIFESERKKQQQRKYRRQIKLFTSFTRLIDHLNDTTNGQTRAVDQHSKCKARRKKHPKEI